jgi:hypothetical protein
MWMLNDVRRLYLAVFLEDIYRLWKSRLKWAIYLHVPLDKNDRPIRPSVVCKIWMCESHSNRLYAKCVVKQYKCE